MSTPSKSPKNRLSYKPTTNEDETSMAVKISVYIIMTGILALMVIKKDKMSNTNHKADSTFPKVIFDDNGNIYKIFYINGKVHILKNGEEIPESKIQNF